MVFSGNFDTISAPEWQRRFGGQSRVAIDRDRCVNRCTRRKMVMLLTPVVNSQGEQRGKIDRVGPRAPASRGQIVANLSHMKLRAIGR